MNYSDVHILEITAKSGNRTFLLTVMVNFMRQLDWAKGCLASW